jgi:hypothetical protein
MAPVRWRQQQWRQSLLCCRLHRGPSPPALAPGGWGRAGTECTLPLGQGGQERPQPLWYCYCGRQVTPQGRANSGCSPVPSLQAPIPGGGLTLPRNSARGRLYTGRDASPSPPTRTHAAAPPKCPCLSVSARTRGQANPLAPLGRRQGSVRARQPTSGRRPPAAHACGRWRSWPACA